MQRPAGYTITRVITPAASLALVTLDQAKAALGIDPADTSQDALIQQEIDAVSGAINNYCDRIFVRQTYRDQIRRACDWLGTGRPLETRQWPIPLDNTGAPVLTVTEDGAILDPALWEIEVETGSVYRLDTSAMIYSWIGQVILLDYDAGYDVVPADVEGAALEYLTSRWAARGRDPALRRQTVPDVLTQDWYTDATTPSMSSTVRDWLAPYRKVFV
jgi:Phage gp6-like head-tail connector protein